MTEERSTRTVVREADLHDCVEVSRLLGRLGLGCPPTEEAMRGRWDRLWPANAVVRSIGRTNAGWVLVAGTEIVGFLGCVPVRCFLGEDPLVVGVATMLGVEKPFRSGVYKLYRAFLLQVGVDLTIATTASRFAGLLYERYGAVRVPHPGLDRALMWVVDGSAFVSSVLRKRGHSGRLSAWSGRTAGPLISASLRLLRGWPSSRAETIDLVDAASIDGAFDELWSAVIRGPRRLRTCRDSESLRWHFVDASGESRARFLTLRKGGTIRGYAALLRDDSPAIQLNRMRVADVVLRDEGDKEGFLALMAAALDVSKAAGCHVLELFGLPTHMRKWASDAGALSRPLPGWPFFYRTCRKDLDAVLQREEDWYPSGIDGDISLA